VKTIIHHYRGRLIASFNIGQLLDEDVSGRAYSVYRSPEHYASGEDALSARERLDSLRDAKIFVDELIRAEGIA
jgi:hypothetical protein